MRKQFLILTIFILVSVVSSHAYEVNQNNSYKLMIIPAASKSDVLNSGLKFEKNYFEQVQKERAAISNALILSESQTKAKNEIAYKYSNLLNEKFENLEDANIKLEVLKTIGDTKAIKNQENEISSIKKEIKTLVNQETKELKKILDRDQRAKLSMIKKLQRKAIKDMSRKKDYYKSNPKMRMFAPNIE